MKTWKSRLDRRRPRRRFEPAWRWLALAALAFTAGCSSFRFEPTANWLRDGGRLCALDRETSFNDWDRAAPRACAQAFSDAPALAQEDVARAPNSSLTKIWLSAPL